MMEELKLTELESDALREIANVGAGHASGALSNLIHKKIDLQIPEVRIEWLRDPRESDKQNEVIAIFSPVHRDGIIGNFILSLPWQCYVAFMREIDKQEGVEDVTENSEEIRQLGYAVFDSYQAAMSQFLQFNVSYKDPKYVLSSKDEVIFHIFKSIEHMDKYVFIISTEFIAEDSNINGKFEMTLSAKGLDVILGRIREKFGF